MRSCPVLLLLSALLLNGGCLPGGGIVEVAAPSAPPPVVPTFDSLDVPPAPGLTRVVLDANGERATVTEVLDWSDSSAIAIGASVQVMDHAEHTRPVCLTPCEFDFEPGLHVLRFYVGPSRSDNVKVQVGGKRKLVRVALGKLIPSEAPNATGMVLQTLGITAVLVGASLWGASSLAPEERQQGYKSSGIALTVGGGVGLLAGIGLAYTKPGTHQPSTVTEVTLPLETPASNASE
jgi:hypothetical protein